MLYDFKYSLKVLLRNKGLLFWTFVFPIVLGTFFNMAFSNIENSERFNAFDIAIVNDENFNLTYKNIFDSLSDVNNEDRLFNVNYVSLEEAKNLLKENKVAGYLVFNDNIDIYVNKSGANETVLRFVVDEINSKKSIYESLSDESLDIDRIVSESEVKLKDISRSNLSYTMIEYYTLIAMAILYGSTISMFITNKKMPNMDSVGKRISVSPTRKSSSLLGSLFASYVVQLLGVAILFIYTIFVLNVDYGNNFFLVIVLSLVGVLAGLSLGVMIATLFKANEGNKMGILIAITMLFCFLSGMMGITMKYVIDKNIPILNIINPANMITDGFYSLYYYDTLDRYYFNLISLLVFYIIALLISFFSIRRQKYDSI